MRHGIGIGLRVLAEGAGRDEHTIQAELVSVDDSIDATVVCLARHGGPTLGTDIAHSHEQVDHGFLEQGQRGTLQSFQQFDADSLIEAGDSVLACSSGSTMAPEVAPDDGTRPVDPRPSLPRCFLAPVLGQNGSKNVLATYGPIDESCLGGIEARWGRSLRARFPPPTHGATSSGPVVAMA